MTPRRPSIRGLAGCVAVAMLLASSTTHAQPAKPQASTSAQDTATAEARARFEEGIKHAEAGDHEAARLKFNQAWALVKSPAILYNLARAEQLSGHHVEALDHYRQFAKLPPDPKVTDVQRQRAAESITELSKKVGQIAVEAPAGARISVDGRPVDPGNTDPIPVTPGKHVVEAIAGGKVKTVDVECPAGTITKAKLVDDAQQAGSATATPGPAPEANASRVDDAATAPPAATDAGSSFWTGGRIAGLGVFAGGLAALGVGVVFQLGAADSKAEADKIRTALPSSSACTDQANDANDANEELCGALEKNVDEQRQRETLRTAFFIGGGALVVGGAVLFLVSPPKSEAPRTGMRVLPFMSGRDAGVAVLGRF